MDFAQVLALIQAEIVANGNNEITANVLRPVLEAMLEQPNDLIGDLGDLETSDQSNLVAAINEIISTILPSINDGTKVIEVFRPFTEAGGGVSELQNVCNIVNAYNPFEIPANQVGVISFLQFFLQSKENKNLKIFSNIYSKTFLNKIKVKYINIFVALYCLSWSLKLTYWQNHYSFGPIKTVIKQFNFLLKQL